MAIVSRILDEKAREVGNHSACFSSNGPFGQEKTLMADFRHPLYSRVPAEDTHFVHFLAFPLFWQARRQKSGPKENVAAETLALLQH